MRSRFNKGYVRTIKEENQGHFTYDRHSVNEDDTEDQLHQVPQTPLGPNINVINAGNGRDGRLCPGGDEESPPRQRVAAGFNGAGVSRKWVGPRYTSIPDARSVSGDSAW